VIALRANGVSFTRIFLPVLFFALLMTGICFWINIEAAPRAQWSMLTSLFRIATHDPASMFQADEVVDQFPDRRVYVGAREGDMLKNLVVFEIDERGYPSKVVYAKTGSITTDEANQRLLLRVKDAHFEQRDQRQPDNVDLIQQGISMEEGVFPMFAPQAHRDQEAQQAAEFPHAAGAFRRDRQAGLPPPPRLRGRGEQALLPLARGHRLRAHRRAARDHRPPQGDLGRLRAEPRDRLRVFLFHHHRGHLPREAAGDADPADLAPQHSFHGTRGMALHAAGPQVTSWTRRRANG